MNDTSNNATPALTCQEWLTFLRLFLKSPRSVASVAPSSKHLGRLMAAALPSGARRIIELGPGTGAITNALIEHGIRPPDLCLIEMNPTLHSILQERFPGIHAVCGDARHLHSLSEAWRELAPHAIDVVCSSLGLLALPSDVRHAILTAAFDVLRPGGVFIQYTYGVTCPVGSEIREQLCLRYKSAGFTWRNLPPARVFVYRQR